MFMLRLEADRCGGVASHHWAAGSRGVGDGSGKRAEPRTPPREFGVRAVPRQTGTVCLLPHEYILQRTAIHRFPINLLLRVYLRRQTSPLGHLRATGIYGACIYGACREVLLGLLLRTQIWLRIQFLSCIHCNVTVLLVHCSIDFKELQTCHSTSIL